jgi:hypothetical protein
MFEPARSCYIRQDCVDHLNRILIECDANIVVSSAWRYMVSGGSMTETGFEYLLRTHRIACTTRIEGFTPTDEEIEGRGRQIRAWLNEHGDGRPYVVLDDMDEGITENGLKFVQTNGSTGLTEADADRAIAILKGER